MTVFLVPMLTREETVICQLHIGYPYMYDSPLFTKWGKPPVCIPCDELLTIEAGIFALWL